MFTEGESRDSSSRVVGRSLALSPITDSSSSVIVARLFLFAALEFSRCRLAEVHFVGELLVRERDPPLHMANSTCLLDRDFLALCKVAVTDFGFTPLVLVGAVVVLKASLVGARAIASSVSVASTR